MPVNLSKARDNWCFIHHRAEDCEYWRCFECGHGWDSPAELVRDHNDVVREMNEHLDLDIPIETDAEQIGICPFCSHDF